MLHWQEPQRLPNSSTSPDRGSGRLPNPSTSDVTTGFWLIFCGAVTLRVEALLARPGSQVASHPSRGQCSRIPPHPLSCVLVARG